MLELRIQAADGKARCGVLRTSRGDVPTPGFMPCGTCGAVKGVTPEQLRGCGVRMLLGNTYHLMLRPGADVVAELGGLHRMMGWDGPILTDSGGFQVFSLAHLREVTDDGVRFRSHVNGSTVELSPEKCIDIQVKMGSDVMMQLDECPPGQADKPAVAEAVRRSALWARRCRQAWLESQERAAAGGEADPSLPARTGAAFDRQGGHPHPGPHQALFGIQQGGVHLDLRRESAEALVALDLPGYAVGGLSVGEGRDGLLKVLEEIDGLLPRHRPRYLMGVGEPRDILAGVAAGIDLFDCVMPTRNARNAQAFTWTGRLRLRNAVHARDRRPLEEDCPCYTCRNFSRGALRHYLQAEEMLAPTLLTIHNLTFFGRLLDAIRQAIGEGRLAASASRWLEAMYPKDETS